MVGSSNNYNQLPIFLAHQQKASPENSELTFSLIVNLLPDQSLPIH